MSSPFRTASLPCPHCGTTTLEAGDVRHCTTCKGSWVPQEALRARIRTMTSEPDPKIRWRGIDQRAGRACAACAQPMKPLLLYDVPVDRCDAHGVWFDPGELAEVLHRSAGHRTEAPGGGAGGTFAVVGAVEIVLEVLADLFFSNA